MPETLVVIPALNAAATLPELIEKIQALGEHLTVLVVNDGSSDNTSGVAEAAGAVVTRHSENRGKGVALQSGFDYAVRQDFRYVITIDADLQHDPTEIPKLLSRRRFDNTIVIGCRPLAREMPLARRISNSLSSFMTSIFAGRHISDSQSGYRLIPVSLLRDLELSSSRYELEPELLIRVARKGCQIVDVEVRTIYNSSRSGIAPFRDTIRFLKMLFKSLFW